MQIDAGSTHILAKKGKKVLSESALCWSKPASPMHQYLGLGCLASSPERIDCPVNMEGGRLNLPLRWAVDNQQGS